MSRLPALEASDFAPIRQLLKASYGDAFANAAIEPVETGSQSYTYKITQPAGSAYYFKISGQEQSTRSGLPEQFSRFLNQQNIPSAFFETMKDGKITRRLPDNIREVRELIPSLQNDEIALQRLQGGVLSLAQAMKGNALPSPSRNTAEYQALFPDMASQVGELAGKIAAQTQPFLSSHHLTINELPPNQYTQFDERANRLLKALHLDKFGNFEEVHRMLHDPKSSASHHLHEHAEIMRHNAQAMLRVASQKQDTTLAESGALLNQFAARYEAGYALSMMHHTHKMLKRKEELLKRQNHLVHGDFWHENILQENGKISGVIDFDRVQKGDKFYDIAKFFTQHRFNPYLVQQSLKGFERGYGSTLDKNDLSMLPVVLMQQELQDLPLDLEKAWKELLPAVGNDTVLTRKMSDSEIAAFTTKPMQDRTLKKCLFGRMDALTPYIQADYEKLMQEKQFDTSLFRKSGRIHVEGGNSCFDYIGAVFGPKDFTSENAPRLIEKLDTVIDNQVRIAQFEAANPTRKDYIIDELVQTYPHIVISESERADKRQKLTQEIQAKLAANHSTAHGSEAHIEKLIGELPPLVQEWLYLKGTEFIFTDKTVKSADGSIRYKGNEDLFPNHTSVSNLRNAGGNFLTFHPEQQDAITYAYTSMQRSPIVLLAHEAIGHAIYNQVRQRDPQNAGKVTESAMLAIIADCGDVNKTASANPNTGRLGALKKAVEENKDDAALWNALSALDGSKLPALSEKDRKKWLSNVRELVNDTYNKMGPKGWMYTVPMYAERNLFVDELMSATAEQMFVSGKGKESELAFVLPALTGFFAGTLLPDMERFVNEKQPKAEPEKAPSSPSANTEDRVALADISAKREEAKKLKFIGTIAGIAGGAIATIAIGGAIMATSWATVPVLACMGVASLVGLGTSYKTVNDSLAITDSIQAERLSMQRKKSAETLSTNVTLEPEGGKSQNWTRQVEQDRAVAAGRAA
jgi:hypothetical protein